jgi:hypothetical protein
VTLPRVPAERSESRGPRSCKACCAPIFGNALRDSCAGSRVSFRARKGARCTRPGHETSLGSAPMPIGASSYSRCQTAHPPPLKLRRASKQARHSLGVGGQSSSFPRRVFVRGFFPSAFPSHLPPRMRGGGAPKAGHWHFRRACEARRLASRATGGRLSALQRGDFRLRDQRFIFRQCPPESAPRLRPRPGARARPIGSRASRDDGSLRATGRHFPAQPSRRLRRRPA